MGAPLLFFSPLAVSVGHVVSIAMSHPADTGTRPPYAPFLALSRYWRWVVVGGAVVTVVAFGFISISIRFGEGGSGWPMHDVLHPLLGILLGPVYGTISAVLGTAISEVVTPYTALDGLSPLLGGTAALATGLLAQERRGWKGLWGTMLALQVLYLVHGWGRAIPFDVWVGNTLLVLLALALAGAPPVRAWWRRHLTPSAWSWQTAAALYVLTFVGSAFSILPLWVFGMMTDPLPDQVWMMVTPAIYLERTLFPLLATLLGVALWPALRRGPFSIANQLRYGLPVCLLLTVFFAGRLLVEQAYDDAQAEITRQVRHKSQAAAQAVNDQLRDAAIRLRSQAPSPGTARPGPFFWSIGSVSVGDSSVSSLPAGAQPLVERARGTGRAQYGFVSLPDTTAQSIALAVPTRAAPPVIRVGVLAPSELRGILSIWAGTPGHLYLVTRENTVIAGPDRPTRDTASSSFLNRLRAASSGTAEAARGRYERDVLGALAPLEDLPGDVVVERAREEAYFHVFELLMSMALITLVASGGALAIGVFLSRRVVDPLDRLIDAARRVGNGELDTRVSVDQENELGELARSFNAMTEDLSASVQRLRANDERLRLALNAARMGTWDWTAVPEVVSWSPQTYALLGVPEGHTEDLPTTYLARVHPDDRTQILRRLIAILESETDFEFEHRVRPDRSTVRWVKVKGRVTRAEDGHPQRMSGVIMDITARKEAEHELVAAKEEAEEMSRLKSAFLANVSHEIRTPLTSIIGFADVLSDEATGQQEEVAEKVMRSGRRLKATLDSVLDLSMIEAGEFSLNTRTVDVAEEVRRRTELLRPMAERKDLTFTVDAPEEGPEAEVDPNGLDRILTNLVTNAIKFTEEGGVTVRVSSEPSHVVLTVEDTGIGISEDFLPKLFEAFKQESEGLQREHEGTGLGLSITKELVDLMDGEIAVDSQKGEGTTFTVRLPYRANDEQ